MQAMVYHEYGSTDVLHLEEVEKPTPADDEVLVKVHASSINEWDWGLLHGTPFLNRLITQGYQKPRVTILGTDIAGQVEAIGSSVTRFKPGDDVFGDISGSGWGGFAEYVCVREKALMPKPTSLTFAQAAAVPHTGGLAMQSLCDKGQLQPGQTVLLNGAGGGAGTIAIQLAKYIGAEVTGVDSTRKLDLMRSLGADHVIDYTQEDFTRNGQGYDLIIDVVAERSIFDYQRALNPGGKYVMVGGTMGVIAQFVALGFLVSRLSNKQLGLLAHQANKGLDDLTELFDAGKITPIVDKQYPLSEVAEAFQYFGDGLALGKVVVIIEPDNTA